MPLRQEAHAAPVNSGCLPGTLNPADGAEIDAVWLGPPIRVGTVLMAAPLGLLHLLDDDHKVIFSAGEMEQNAEHRDDGKTAGLVSPRTRRRLLGPLEALTWLELLATTSG